MTTLDVLPVMLELEAQVDQAGWDNGVGVWGLHAEHEEGDPPGLVPMKIGGPEYTDAHPIEVLRNMMPPPPCYAGMVVSYECWTSRNNISPPSHDPDRIDTRYLITALRTGVVWAIEHVRDCKPRAFLLDPVRALALGGVADVSMVLRRLVEPAPDMPPGLRELLEALSRGEGPLEGGGFFIIGGGA